MDSRKLHDVLDKYGIPNSFELFISYLDLVVEEQLRDGDRVASRFVVSGKSFGRKVRFNGITISRLKEGSIVEDWSVTDTLGMLRHWAHGDQCWSAFASGEPRGTRRPQSKVQVRSGFCINSLCLGYTDTRDLSCFGPFGEVRHLKSRVRKEGRCTCLVQGVA